MRQNYKRLGDYIQVVNERNADLSDLPLLGVSVQKIFFPSIANTIGTDMSTYKLIRKRQFTYIPDTSRRGDKIGIALQEEFDLALVSQAYTVFEITDTAKLLPEYLMMWFRRQEFDRYARYKSHGSAREIFDWNEMCETLLPVPSPEKQRQLVNEYHVLVDRINLNSRLIQKLEETAQALYKEWFVDFEFPVTSHIEGHIEGATPSRTLNNKALGYKSSGGEMVESEMGMIPKGWKKEKLKNICDKIGSGATPTGGKESYTNQGISLIRSTNVFDYNFSFDDLAFINDKQADKLKNVEVERNDILFNITGVSVARCCMVPENVLPARVNQHVMIIRPNIDLKISFYLLLNLCSTDSKSKLLGISQSGSTREAITKSEIENFEIILPKDDILLRFNNLMQQEFLFRDLKSFENQKLSELKELLLSKLATVNQY